MGGRGNSGGGGSGGVKTINATEAFNKTKESFLKAQQEAKDINLPGEYGRYLNGRKDATGGTQAQFDFIKNYVESKGWTVRRTPKISDDYATTLGITRIRERLIEVRSDLPIGSQIKVLAHETFHALNHVRVKRSSALGKVSPQRKHGAQEMQAEAFADMVGRKMGIKDKYSGYYIDKHSKFSGPNGDFLDKSQPLLEQNFNNLFED